MSDTIIYNKEGIILHNADCMQVIRQMPDCSVDLVCTDPPYRCSPRGHGGTWCEWQNDGKCFPHNDIRPEEWLPEVYRVLKDRTHCYIMTNNLNLCRFIDVGRECGFKFLKSLIWLKSNRICCHHYMNSYEHILMFAKGKDRIINNPSTPDVIRVDGWRKLRNGDGNLHNTEKPVELMKTLIGNSTNEGEVVLEPFAGIGSTAIAAKCLNRRCIACEIDASFASTAVRRLEDQPVVDTGQITMF